MNAEQALKVAREALEEISEGRVHPQQIAQNVLFAISKIAPPVAEAILAQMTVDEMNIRNHQLHNESISARLVLEFTQEQMITYGRQQRQEGRRDAHETNVTLLLERDKMREQAEKAHYSFKNFHWSLCKRFGYAHDDRDWQRDQVSLEEHIAKLMAVPAQPGTEPRRANKIGGSYQAAGTIVSEFRTLAGEQRFVFEFDAPKGMLHIFGPSQVEFNQG